MVINNQEFEHSYKSIKSYFANVLETGESQENHR